MPVIVYHTCIRSVGTRWLQQLSLASPSGLRPAQPAEEERCCNNRTRNFCATEPCPRQPGRAGPNLPSLTRLYVIHNLPTAIAPSVHAPLTPVDTHAQNMYPNFGEQDAVHIPYRAVSFTQK